jgi:two-component system, LytTR family, response regulator
MKVMQLQQDYSPWEMQKRIESLSEEILLLQAQLLTKKEKTLLIRNNGLNQVVNVNDIIVICGDSNYSTIRLSNGKKILTSKTLKYWQELIDVSILKRIHKSTIINMERVQFINKSSRSITMDGDIEVKYSRDTKLEFYQ